MKKQTKKSKPSTEDLQEQIRRRAYELWEQAGREHGRDTEHWLQAEWEVNQQPKTVRT